MTNRVPKKAKVSCEVGFFRGIDHVLLICRRFKGHKGYHQELDISPWSKYKQKVHDKKYLQIFGVAKAKEQGRIGG